MQNISTKLKIAFFIDTISCDTSGTEKQLIATISRLNRNFFEPILIVLHDSHWLQNNALPCRQISLNYSGFFSIKFFSVIKHFIQLIENLKIDIIQTFFNDTIFITYLVSYLSPRKFVFITSRRDIGLGILNQPWYHRLYKLLFPIISYRYDGVITNSHEVKKYVISHEKIRDDKIVAINNGIDLPTFNLNRNLPIVKQSSEIWIVMTASFNPVKRHDILLNAIEILSKSINHLFKVILLGSGPLQSQIQASAKMLKVNEYLFFAGSVQNVTDYLRHSDIAMLCSDREGLSNAIIEYMVCGLPVIATAVGGNVDLVNDYNGILIPPNSPQSLANALRHLICNQNERDRLGQAAKSFIVDNFSWEQTMNATESYYIKCFNKKGRTFVN